MSEAMIKFNEKGEEFLTKMLATYPNEPKIRDFLFKFMLVKHTDMPIKMFMDYLEPFGYQIMSGDEQFFKQEHYVNNVESMSGKLGLVKYWDSMSQQTKNAIWEYMRVLYAWGMKYMNKIEDLKLIIDRVNKDKAAK